MDKTTERLYQAAKILKDLNTPSQIARVLNTSPQTVKNWESRGISKQGIIDAQREIGISAQWIETGNGDMSIFKPIKIRPESNATFIGGVEEWDNNTPLRDDEVEVPFYKEICLAAGAGAYTDIQDYNGMKLRFSKATFRRKGIMAENVTCSTASGNSMEPTIPDGTTIGIDRGDTNIKDGKIYAINHDGLLRIKVLKNRPGNRVLIQSFNSEEYPDEEVDMQDIQIIGRVFWWSVLD